MSYAKLQNEEELSSISTHSQGPGMTSGEFMHLRSVTCLSEAIVFHAQFVCLSVRTLPGKLIAIRISSSPSTTAAAIRAAVQKEEG